MVADHTKVTCKSWQTIYIKQQPVVFIRIVGTYNTANEVFHCVHFECPAQNHIRPQSEDSPGDRTEPSQASAAARTDSSR
ncbi:BTB/POZ domain-containing protein 9-like [Amblyraja radiata]|uniref:BTB/POZ domain-containing protein 9-like n=1 Tax=Amblyraja radiata TaxID=386614 RepID=UPI0014033958|nr:BTB/POZ domain-containing protein 9-like [Amblyraja radiata]